MSAVEKSGSRVLDQFWMIADQHGVRMYLFGIILPGFISIFLLDDRLIFLVMGKSDTRMGHENDYATGACYILSET